jgi:hypothetical protein
MNKEHLSAGYSLHEALGGGNGIRPLFLHLDSFLLQPDLIILPQPIEALHMGLEVLQ